MLTHSGPGLLEHTCVVRESQEAARRSVFALPISGSEAAV
jgi:hypothetical protein